MGKYRAGVIGHTGRGHYGHGLDTVYLDMPEVEIVAVADGDPAGLRSAGARLGVPPAGQYADYRQMLQRERLDIVSVAPRWPDQHSEMVTAAAESGVRGVFCEKPLARTLEEADRMLAACEQSGAKVAVAHQYRVHPFVRELRKRVETGAIGEVREVHGFGKQDSRGGGQDLMVLGTHVLDLMCFLFGRPRWVQASVFQDGDDAAREHVRPGDEEIGPILGDHLHAVYAFEGVVGHFFSRRGGAEFGNRSMGVHVYGTRGVLAFQAGYLLHYPHPCWSPAGDVRWEVVMGPGRMGMEPLNAMLVRDLVEAFERGREPVSSGDDARWALEMILGVYAAHRWGRTPLPLQDREHPLRAWN
jgi:predicted dehydrogenase